MSEKCQKTGCSAPATCKPALCIPEVGKPAPSDRCLLTMRYELPLCDAHFGALEPAPFLEVVRPRLDALFASKGVKPDYARAWFDKLTSRALN